MIKAIKIIFTVTLLVAASFVGTIMVYSAADVSPAVQSEPLFEMAITGEIARSSTSTNWLKKDEPATLFADFSFDYLLTSYQNPLPSEVETQNLEHAGFDSVMLPFLANEDLEFMLKEGHFEAEPMLREKLSVLEFTQEQNLTVLNLSGHVKDEELLDILAEVADGYVVVKFSQLTEPWDGELFLEKAKTAIDYGADIIIGEDTNDAHPIQIYNECVIIPGLGGFLGGKAEAGFVVLIGFYEGGISVEVEPLAIVSGKPSLLRSPWQYLQAQRLVKDKISGDFTVNLYKGIYLSPDLQPEQTESEAEIVPEQGGVTAEAISQHGFGVAAGHPLAVDAGMEILEAGGNAVDAAVAVAYALAVVEPDGSGLGGGGIMLMHLAEEDRQVVVDYRETAPSTMNKSEIEKIMNWPSTGIPGFVSGLEKATEEFGTLEYAEVIRPAFRLAQDGFPVSAGLERRLRNSSGKIARSPTALKSFFRNGWPIPAGEIVTQPTLAQTLQRIMDEGSSVFYQGYIADTFIEVLAGQGMQVSRKDLENYQPVIREPLRGQYRDLDVVTVPPPAGGFNLLQQLMILNHFDFASYSHESPETYKLLEEVAKATYSDRRSYIGDPNFVNSPLDELLSEEYVAEKVALINTGQIPQEMFTDAYRPSDNTTHFVVVDAAGNWVSVTNTLSYGFGNGLQAEGFFLNTQLKNFSSNPSSPNYFQPGKRPFSHISPSLVFQDGSPIMALGTPGGRRIPAYLAQLLVFMTDFSLDVEDAVNLPRFWSEGKTIWVEKQMPKAVSRYYQERGYEVITWNPGSYFGRMAVIRFNAEDETYTGTGDPMRGEGSINLNF